jgi:hypothetical protein
MLEYVFIFGLAMPFHNRKYWAFNHFLAGRPIAGRWPNGKAAFSSPCGPLKGEFSARRHPLLPDVPACWSDNANGRLAKAGIWQ